MFLDAPYIKQDYYNCLSENLSNRMKASKLKNFQAKYEEQLKHISPSVKTDGTYQLNNLYDQITSQIRYYENLANKDAQNNKPSTQNLGLSNKHRAELAHQKKTYKRRFYK